MRYKRLYSFARAGTRYDSNGTAYVPGIVHCVQDGDAYVDTSGEIKKWKGDNPERLVYPIFTEVPKPKRRAVEYGDTLPQPYGFTCSSSSYSLPCWVRDSEDEDWVNANLVAILGPKIDCRYVVRDEHTCDRAWRFCEIEVQDE